MRILCFIIFILMSTSYVQAYEIMQDQKIGYGKQKVIRPDQVDRINFHVYQVSNVSGQSTYNGYVIFYDVYGNHCLVSSGNPLYVWVGGYGDSPDRLSLGTYGYYKEIILGTGAFKLIKLRSGELVYGVPIGKFVVNYKTEEEARKAAKTPPLVKMYWYAEGKREFKRDQRPYAPY